jgi:hypothetical protein
MNKLRLFCLLGLASIVLSSCGRYPAVLRSIRDIDVTPASYYAISIGNLPMDLYPKLQKFVEVAHVSYEPNSKGATDEKLILLSTVKLPRLKGITCSGINRPGDSGVLSLAVFPTLEYLQLTNANITEKTIHGLGEFPSLNSISIVGCKQVSKDGIMVLCKARNWVGVGFSADFLSTEEVIAAISFLPRGAECTIVDETLHLDEFRLKEAAASRGLRLDLRKDFVYPGYK